MAGYAAERATHVAAARLREVHEHMGELLRQGANATEADVDFHRELARMTGNELFGLVLDSIGDVLLEVRNATWRRPELYVLAYQNHGKILVAVEDRAPGAARVAMRTHLVDGFARWQALESACGDDIAKQQPPLAASV